VLHLFAPGGSVASVVIPGMPWPGRRIGARWASRCLARPSRRGGSAFLLAPGALTAAITGATIISAETCIIDVTNGHRDTIAA
jgi:hypothetical protein